MERKTKPNDIPRSKKEKTDKVPWWVGLDVKDIVRPITIRRVHILNIVVLLLVLAGIGYYAWNSFFRQPTGEELVSEMVEAAGGMNAWNNIHNGQFTRTHNIYSESGELLKSTKETFYFKRTNEGVKLQVRASNKDGQEVWIGQDREGFWASAAENVADPKKTAKELGMMCDSQFCEPLCASSMAFYRFSMPFKLTDDGVQPNVASADLSMKDLKLMNNSGKEPIVLDITYDPKVGRDRWKFIVDPSDKLIHKIEYYNKSDKGETRPEEIYWSDHKAIAGITFSHKWTRYWGNGQLMDEYIFSDVDFETELTEDFFKRPAQYALGI